MLHQILNIIYNIFSFGANFNTYSSKKPFFYMLQQTRALGSLIAALEPGAVSVESGEAAASRGQWLQCSRGSTGLFFRGFRAPLCSRGFVWAWCPLSCSHRPQCNAALSSSLPSPNMKLNTNKSFALICLAMIESLNVIVFRVLTAGSVAKKWNLEGI